MKFLYKINNFIKIIWLSNPHLTIGIILDNIISINIKILGIINILH